MLLLCSQNVWQGRSDPSDKSRFHQQVKITSNAAADTISIIGFCSDEGVKRNQGRSGAVEGPYAIRSSLANLVYSGSRQINDLGNVVCVDSNLELAQQRLAVLVSQCLSHRSFPIVFGGGHEVAWGSYQGIRRVFARDKIGIINFDAHFDLRPVESMGSSGTPFRQMADWSRNQAVDFNYLVLGINESANAPNLFNYADDNGVQWLNDIDCDDFQRAKHIVDVFAEKVDYLYLSICLDVFPAWVAPGVSAPAVPGIDPRLVLKLIRHLAAKYGDKVVLMDIAEMNPTYDIDNRTAKLAARLIQTYLTSSYP